MIRVKICGIRSLNDALAAVEAGADLVGFNFHRPSPRYIPAEDCRAIVSGLRGRVTTVGVFVNAGTEQVRETLDFCGLDLAQLHGDEPVDVLQALDGRAFKALRGVPAYLNGYARPDPPSLLVDASVPGVYGGSGVRADWEAAARLALRRPILLAGGLTPENVAQAVKQVNPWGVDAASGVEARPGVKDPVRMTAFVRAARS